MKPKECQQNRAIRSLPNIETEERGDATGRSVLGCGSSDRLRRMRSMSCCQWFYKVKMDTAHGSTDKSQTKNDLVSDREGDGVEEVTANQRRHHERDGEHHIANASHV